MGRTVRGCHLHLLARQRSFLLYCCGGRANFIARVYPLFTPGQRFARRADRGWKNAGWWITDMYNSR